MKKILISISLFVIGFTTVLPFFFREEDPKIQFFIEKKLIAEFPVYGKRFYRTRSTGVSIILEKHEGLMLLAKTIEFSPKKGDLMEIKFSGELMYSQKNTKPVDSFVSILASAFPPQIVSLSFESKECLERTVHMLSWIEEKDFLFNPLERIPNLHPSSSLDVVETLVGQIDLTLFLFKKRKADFLHFLGYDNSDEILQDKDFHEWIDDILVFHDDPECSGEVRMLRVGTWCE